MDIQSARHYTRTLLAESCDMDESDYLLGYVLAKDRAWLYAHSEYKLSQAQSNRLKQLVEKRKAGKPLAYIKGYQEFYSLKFLVNEAVLIPRPETEIAVACAINSMLPNARLLDLGTGCGNIAIAIAHHRPDLHIVASDISPSALDVAQANATRHRCKMTFVHSDWYQNIDGDFDWIISNPPYIATDDFDADRHAIASEPKLALYAEDRGTVGLNSVITGAERHLCSRGTLLVEHGCKQAEAAAQRMHSSGFSRIHCLKDIAHHPRYTMAHRK